MNPYVRAIFMIIVFLILNTVFVAVGIKSSFNGMVITYLLIKIYEMEAKNEKDTDI